MINDQCIDALLNKERALFKGFVGAFVFRYLLWWDRQLIEFNSIDNVRCSIPHPTWMWTSSQYRIPSIPLMEPRCCIHTIFSSTFQIVCKTCSGWGRQTQKEKWRSMEKSLLPGRQDKTKVLLVIISAAAARWEAGNAPWFKWHLSSWVIFAKHNIDQPNVLKRPFWFGQLYWDEHKYVVKSWSRFAMYWGHNFLFWPTKVPGCSVQLCNTWDRLSWEDKRQWQG